jgi:thiamine pyrophosphokinase
MICLNSDVMEKEIPSLATLGLWSDSTFASFYCADGASNRIYDGLRDTPVLLAACRPEYIVGDLDSMRRDVATYYESVGTKIVKNPDQDTNDLEKCVEHLLSQNVSIESNGLSMNEITLVVMGAFGGRFDQQMHSLHVCYKYMDTFKSINLVGDGNCAYLLKGGLDTTHYINLQKGIEGPGCSLLPIGTPVRSIFTTGLKWNLDGQSMGYGQLVSSSNCLEDSNNSEQSKAQLTVRTEDTLLLCFDLDLRKTAADAASSEKGSRIRMAVAEDLDAIMQIIGEVVPLMNAAGNFQWDEKYPTREAFTNDITNQVLYVAELRDTLASAYKVVGVAALTEDQSPEYADCGWDLTIPSIVTHRLAVSPSARRQGIALKLFNQADILAKERGYDRVRVDTNKLNTPMQNVMLKAGYVYAGEISLNSKPKDMRFFCFEKMM